MAIFCCSKCKALTETSLPGEAPRTCKCGSYMWAVVVADEGLHPLKVYDSIYTVATVTEMRAPSGKTEA